MLALQIKQLWFAKVVILKFSPELASQNIEWGREKQMQHSQLKALGGLQRVYCFPWAAPRLQFLASSAIGRVLVLSFSPQNKNFWSKIVTLHLAHTYKTYTHILQGLFSFLPVVNSNSGFSGTLVPCTEDGGA